MVRSPAQAFTSFAVRTSSVGPPAEPVELRRVGIKVVSTDLVSSENG
jgi:hypothetical protein